MAAVNDIYSVKIISRNFAALVNPIVALNVVHYKVTQVDGAGKGDEEIALTMDLNFAAPYKAYFTADSAYRGVIIQKIFPLPISAAEVNTNGQGPGTRVAGDTLPGQVSGIITKRTLGAGRAKRGRIYIPFPGEDDSTDGLPNAGYFAALNGLLVPFFNGISVGLLPDRVIMLPGIFHRATPLVFDFLTSVQSRAYFVTQRRRGEVSGPDISPV